MKTKVLSRITNLKQINKSTITFYLLSILIPAIILSISRLFYLLDILSLYPNMLTLPAIPCCAFAGFCFAYYIRHSQKISLNNIFWQLACAAAYSLCSYGITQESDVLSMILYAFFPIIFLTFEQMVCQINYIPFILCCTLMLILQPSAGLPIFLLLFILAIIELSLQHKLNLGNFVHVFLCFLLSFILAAARVFYYLAPAIADHTSYSYQGFSLAFSPAVFLTRFLPGVASSKLYVGTFDRMDLYFGLFFLFAALCFFFQKDQAKKKRLFYGIFTFIIIGVLEFSPLQYVFHFFMNTYGLTTTCSFFLIFWILHLAMEAIPNLKKTSLFSLTVPCIILFLFEIIAWLWCFHNFSTLAFVVNIIFVLFYIVILFINRYSKRFCIAHKIWYIMILLELTANCILSTTTTLYTSQVTADTKFYFQKEDMTTTKENPDQKEYMDFILTYQAETDFLETLEELSSSTNLSGEEIANYCSTILPNDFEYINGLCYKYGINKPLFQPVTATPRFDKDTSAIITDQGNNVFNIDLREQNITESNVLIPYHIEIQDTLSDSLYYMENYSGQIIKFDKNLSEKETTCYLYPQVSNEYTYNIKFIFYTIDNAVYQQLCDKLIHIENTNKVSEKKPSETTLIIDYIGVFLSYLGGMVLIIIQFYNSKEKLYFMLYEKKEQLNCCALPHKLYLFLYQNRIYLLSFFIPVFFYLICMIYTNCTPFGEASFHDSDSAGLFLPLFLENDHKYELGNEHLSMNIGYGFDLSIYSTISASSKLYHFLPMNYIAPFLLIMIGIALGFCGLTMMYYMTHRLTEKKANKKDALLLIPAMIYALNAYILTSHCFLTWYFTLILFPLLMLATDKLIIEKKTFPYIALLAGCILLEIQLAMFMCIYLVIRFFTYHFDNIRDFLQKGVRFAISSLLAGGCGFLVVYRTLALYKNTLYTTADTQIPSPGLHTNFLNQWKKLMIFTETQGVSRNNGDLSIYCGILTLLLVLIYFTNKELRFVNKIRKLIPILILVISFNEKLLSWLWNGLHYQSNVPNRYVFLLLFIFAEIAYDGIRHIKNISIFKYGSLCIILISFFFVCQHGGNGNTDLSFLCTILFCSFYLMLHIKHRYNKADKSYYRLLIFFLLFELGGNTFFLTNSWNLTDLTAIYGDYTAQYNFHQSIKEEGTFFRCTFPASPTRYNSGAVYDTPTTGGFNSYLSTQQLNLHHQYGLLCNVNNIRSSYLSTPVGLSLSGSRYIFVPTLATQSLSELSYYNYIGVINNFYVYENTNALSLGTFVPSETLNITPEEAAYSLIFENRLAELFSVNNLLLFQEISYSDNPEDNNSFYFTDFNGKQLSFEEAENLYWNSTSANEFKMNINYTPTKDGFTFLYSYEVIPMKRSEKNKKNNFSCAYSSSTFFPKEYLIAILDDDAMQEFFTEIQKNQMEDITIANDTITGTTNYEEDGYTMFSIAYSKDWSAYIDGEPVEIENPFDSGIYVKTPAGKHTIELRFTPYGLRFGIIVTIAFWAFTFLLHGILYILNRRKMA